MILKKVQEKEARMMLASTKIKFILILFGNSRMGRRVREQRDQNDTVLKFRSSRYLTKVHYLR